MNKLKSWIPKIITITVVLAIVLTFQLLFGCQHTRSVYNKLFCKKKIYTPGELIASNGTGMQFTTIYSFEQYDQPSVFNPQLLARFQLTRLTAESDQIDFSCLVTINTSSTGGILIDKSTTTPHVRPGSELERLIADRKAAYPFMTGLFYSESSDIQDGPRSCIERVTVLNTTTGINSAYFEGLIDCNNNYRQWYERSFDENFNSVAFFAQYQCNSCFSTDKITGSDVLLVIVGSITLYNTLMSLIDQARGLSVDSIKKKFSINAGDADKESGQDLTDEDDDTSKEQGSKFEDENTKKTTSKSWLSIFSCIPRYLFKVVQPEPSRKRVQRFSEPGNDDSDDTDITGVSESKEDPENDQNKQIGSWPATIYKSSHKLFMKKLKNVKLAVMKMMISKQASKLQGSSHGNAV